MEEVISLSEIFVILKRHMMKIIIWVFMGLLLAGLYTFFIVTPQYESTSKIVVNQTQSSSQTITNTDIQTNLNLINTYQSIIKEPIVLQGVLEATGSNLTMAELRKKISIQTENNSLVFGVTVSHENPYESAELSNAIAQSFESKIGDILEVESVTILSEAVFDSEPVSPSIPMNIILGLLVGLIIGVAHAFLAEILNKTVNDDKLIETLDWVNLGAIFEMTADEIKDTRITTVNRKQQVDGKTLRRRV